MDSATAEGGNGRLPQRCDFTGGHSNWQCKQMASPGMQRCERHTVAKKKKLTNSPSPSPKSTLQREKRGVKRTAAAMAVPSEEQEACTSPPPTASLKVEEEDPSSAGNVQEKGEPELSEAVAEPASGEEPAKASPLRFNFTDMLMRGWRGIEREEPPAEKKKKEPDVEGGDDCDWEKVFAAEPAPESGGAEKTTPVPVRENKLMPTPPSSSRVRWNPLLRMLLGKPKSPATPKAKSPITDATPSDTTPARVDSCTPKGPECEAENGGASSHSQEDKRKRKKRRVSTEEHAPVETERDADGGDVAAGRKEVRQEDVVLDNGSEARCQFTGGHKTWQCKKAAVSGWTHCEGHMKKGGKAVAS